MPLSLRPDKRYPIVLEIDQGLPDEVKPMFFANSKDMDEAEDVSNEYNEMLKTCDTQKELNDSICVMLHKHVVGWKNMGNFVFPTSPEEWRTSKVVTFQEAAEIIRKVIANRYLTIEEKKS